MRNKHIVSDFKTRFAKIIQGRDNGSIPPEVAKLMLRRLKQEVNEHSKGKSEVLEVNLEHSPSRAF